MPAERYPLDFDALRKDSWLDTHELIHALNVTPADGSKWNFALVGLAEQITRESGILCRIDHDRIRLMSDAEADDYTFRRLEHHTRGLGTTARRRTLIDRHMLDGAQRQIAESRDRVVFSVALAARTELRKQRKLEGLVHQPTRELEPEIDPEE